MLLSMFPTYFSIEIGNGIRYGGLEDFWKKTSFNYAKNKNERLAPAWVRAPKLRAALVDADSGNPNSNGLGGSGKLRALPKITRIYL